MPLRRQRPVRESSEADKPRGGTRRLSPLLQLPVFRGGDGRDFASVLAPADLEQYEASFNKSGLEYKVSPTPPSFPNDSSFCPGSSA